MSRTQPPLIDLDQLDRNRGAQLAAIDRIGDWLPSGVARDGSRVSAAVMVALLRVFDSLTSEQRPWNWQGVAFWQARAALQSEKTVRRAVQALESFGLIEVRDGSVPGYLRRLSVRIVWTTVFTSEPLTQDAEDLSVWSRRRTRQRRLFGANPVAPIRTQCPDQFGHHDRINSDTSTEFLYIPSAKRSATESAHPSAPGPPTLATARLGGGWMGGWVFEFWFRRDT